MPIRKFIIVVEDSLLKIHLKIKSTWVLIVIPGLQHLCLNFFKHLFVIFLICDNIKIVCIQIYVYVYVNYNNNN